MKTESLDQAKAKALAQFRLARSNLLDYVRFTKSDYITNWHHKLVASKLDKWMRGEIKRLIIQQPPRTGKSEMITRRMPAKILGANPERRVIAASYSGDLANSFNLDAQRIMMGERHRALYPNSYVPTMAPFKNRDKFRQTSNLVEMMVADPKKPGYGMAGGYYKTVGIGGSLTGFGFDDGIIDDPHKDRKEADSKLQRDRVWDWYASTFMSRMEKGARMLVTQTRWHEDDLAGRLLKKGGWEEVTLPHIKDDVVREYDPREEGEILWPWKYSMEELLEIMREGGSREWASLHQQSPITEGGNIVKREWWKFFETPPRIFDQVIQSWDFTFKNTANSDYVVGGVIGVKGPDRFILDVVRRRASFTESVQMITQMSAKWPEAYTKVIEEKANGAAVIDTIKKKMAGVVAFDPGKYGSKEARAHAVSGVIEAGNVHLPEDAPWVHDYLEEWAAFPNGAHDDQVDMTTQALLKIGGSGAERLKRLLNR